MPYIYGLTIVNINKLSSHETLDGGVAFNLTSDETFQGVGRFAEVGLWGFEGRADS
jgi:hypothetical protein